jgi:RNA polymerase sigma factor (sigma-70 family)
MLMGRRHIDQPDPPLAPGPPKAETARAQAERSRIETLFREHNETLVRFLRGRLHNEMDAREAAQEAYVRLLQLDEPAQPSFLRAYLFKVAANVATDVLRRRSTRLRGDGADEERRDKIESATQEQALLARQQLDIAVRALQELPPRCREAFRMSRDEGASSSEIAAALGVSDRMVRLYLARALEHLQAMLGPGGLS